MKKLYVRKVIVEHCENCPHYDVNTPDGGRYFKCVCGANGMLIEILEGKNFPLFCPLENIEKEKL